LQARRHETHPLKIDNTKIDSTIIAEPRGSTRYMEGSVSFDPAGEQDWVEATPNRPMTIGDKIWADKGSRAELQLGTPSIRLSEKYGHVVS